MLPIKHLYKLQEFFQWIASANIVDISTRESYSTIIIQFLLCKWGPHFMSYLIETKNLTKRYGNVTALEGIDLTVSSGEILGLLGANGAGKTTIIQILMGLLTPSIGTATVLGFSPQSHRLSMAHRINFSSAYVHLPSNLTVMENMMVYSRLYGVKNRKEKINQLLTLFGIESLSRRVTGALSSGEKTRLNLCKALLNDPELLLLDEPTASLDPEVADRVRQTLQELQRSRQMGIVYTSHNMKEVEVLCHRILFIHQGRVMAQGTAEEIKNKFDSDSMDEVFIRIVRGK